MTKRRTKIEMILMRREVENWLLKNNNDPHKAWDDYVKYHLKNNLEMVDYIKGIKDFNMVSIELINKMKKERIEKEYKETIKRNKEALTDELKRLTKEDSVQLWKLNKDNLNNDDKITLVEIINMIMSQEYWIEDRHLNLFKKLIISNEQEITVTSKETLTNETLEETKEEVSSTSKEEINKCNMSYDNIKEYYNYLESLPNSSDKDGRYYKLKSYIQRYEYNKQQKENREEHLRDLMREACTLLHFMKKKGLQLINKSDCGISSTKYTYNDNVLHFDVHSNGMPIEEYHTMIYNIFNNHFSDYINEYNQYTLYWYYMPDGNTETLTQIDSYVFIDSTIGEHGIIAYDRRLTDSEINKYKHVTCNYYSDQSII